jgi:hypothetical protein
MVLLVQVHANPREAYELIQVLEAENATLRSAVATAREALLKIRPKCCDGPCERGQDLDDGTCTLTNEVDSALAALDAVTPSKGE